MIDKSIAKIEVSSWMEGSKCKTDVQFPDFPVNSHPEFNNIEYISLNIVEQIMSRAIEEMKKELVTKTVEPLRSKATEIDLFENDCATWGGPDPRGNDAARMNKQTAILLRQLANQIETEIQNIDVNETIIDIDKLLSLV